MRALSCTFGIPCRERSLDKKNVRIPGERNDRGTVGGSVCYVRDVGNLLAGSNGEEITQAAKSLDVAIGGRHSIDMD
jgi:hypothetical protein